jgi:hypothetical protein
MERNYAIKKIWNLDSIIGMQLLAQGTNRENWHKTGACTPIPNSRENVG